MINWLQENLGTIVVALLLIVLVTISIRQIVSDKKKGKSTCGSNCGHCPMGKACHHLAQIKKEKNKRICTKQL